MKETVDLATKVDDDVLPQLYTAGAATLIGIAPQALQDNLIDARAKVENSGYRAPSCLLTNKEGLKKLSKLVSGFSILEQLLVAANINSLHRAQKLDAAGDAPTRLVLLGRRQRIAHGGAVAASPGEEPVDLAVSVPPSLEVVGETDTDTIEIAVRIRFAPRLTDDYGVVNVSTYGGAHVVSF